MTTEPQGLLTQRAVMALIGIGSRETLARWQRRGQFPPPIKIGGGGIRWLPSDIEAWLQRCAAARDERAKLLAARRAKPTSPSKPRGQHHG
jgi:predicted DNA-binding transcriptional regulator AlpA